MDKFPSEKSLSQPVETVRAGWGSHTHGRVCGHQGLGQDPGLGIRLAPKFSSRAESAEQGKRWGRDLGQLRG